MARRINGYFANCVTLGLRQINFDGSPIEINNRPIWQNARATNGRCAARGRPTKCAAGIRDTAVSAENVLRAEYDAFGDSVVAIDLAGQNFDLITHVIGVDCPRRSCPANAIRIRLIRLVLFRK